LCASPTHPGRHAGYVTLFSLHTQGGPREACWVCNTLLSTHPERHAGY